MTYSHNSVSNNLKVTTATAATPKPMRFKSMSSNGGVIIEGDRFSPPSTPPVTAHSNSIVSSTNDHHALSSSPTGSTISSSSSISSNCSVSSYSSFGSTGSGGYYASRNQQRQVQQQHQPVQVQQRNGQQNARFSPQQFGNGGGAFFSNNQQGKRTNGYIGGIAQKQRTPSHNNGQVRQSPAVILGNGIYANGGNSGNNNHSNSSSSSSSSIIIGNSFTTTNNNVSSSGRKNRSKHVNQSPLIIGGGGKISPTYALIPTALTHFAGSKCFDAPAPTALPPPPEHWTLQKVEQDVSSGAGSSLLLALFHQRPKAVEARNCGGHLCSSKSSKRNLLDDFDTHNLKMLLNVQS